MGETFVDKRNTIVMLRWVLIIASAYLLLFGPEGPIMDGGRALFVAAVLASNVVLNRLPERWLHSRTFDLALVVFDTGWLTVSLAWSPHASDDFFMLYFLVLFVVALGESLPMIVGSASLITLVYGWGLNRSFGSQALTSAAFLRILFLFVVALFYGYFVTALRGRRREANEARQLDRAKTDLLASISHDLRVPLGNAENYAMIMLDGHCGLVPDKARTMLARLQANLRRVSTLVSNCLDATRIESGQLHLQCNPTQLNDVIEDALQLEASAAATKGIALERELAPNLPVIAADLMQLGRVVANLVGNALKYTPAGGRVIVRTRMTEDGVCLDVEDTGPGIAAAEQPTVFDRFERLRSGTHQPGTGLGLFIVKNLVRAHGGAVTLKSAEGKGSTFTVTLPVDDLAAAHARLAA
ncbi:MAG: HAMP domain-containing histidine kinase [Deltaproteobacteria bacterium]|nr:HAMP domain-containing histidine kinase [Deltaproteobacteria bacterium]MBI3389547.1 HAMP domain-containing histidine kinase [Deltaproteobacteria bacterium]